MANTRRVSFRLGEEMENKLEELAKEAGSSRTEVVRALITARHAKLYPAEKPKSSGEPGPAQMALDEVLLPGIGGGR